MFDINSIKVYRSQDNQTDVVGVYNPKEYEMIGIGYHGAVFKLSENRCIKIFASQLNAKQEAEIYKAMQFNKSIPKIYKHGPKYIILELIKGKTLYDFLCQKGCLSISITEKILYILRNIRYRQYVCTDIELNNVIVDDNENLKLIDLCEILWMDNRPNSLFKELNDINMLDAFLLNVKQLDSGYYTRLEQAMIEYRKLFKKLNKS